MANLREVVVGDDGDGPPCTVKLGEPNFAGMVKALEVASVTWLASSLGERPRNNPDPSLVVKSCRMSASGCPGRAEPRWRGWSRSTFACGMISWRYT